MVCQAKLRLVAGLLKKRPGVVWGAGSRPSGRGRENVCGPDFRSWRDSRATGGFGFVGGLFGRTLGRGWPVKSARCDATPFSVHRGF